MLAARHRWLREPTVLGRETCVFVAMARAGQPTPHTLRYIEALAARGLGVIVVLVVDDIDAPAATIDVATGVLLRENAGFDFAAWATVLRLLPRLFDQELLVFANDSVFGPFDGFDALIARLRTSSADVIALTESSELRRHFQSYFFAFRRRALRTTAVRQFWSQVRSLGDKWSVVCAYEVTLRERAETAGLKTEILFPLPLADGTNPTLFHWKALIASGYPFIKVSALRDSTPVLDLQSWDTILTAHGADVTAIMRYLQTTAPDAPAIRQAATAGRHDGGTGVPAGTEP